MTTHLRSFIRYSVFVVLSFSSFSAFAQTGCDALPGFEQLREALTQATGSPPAGNGGFNLNMWGAIVDRDGVVCAVVFTGNNRGSQWPGSRVISAQKANTGNAFSLDGLALSTANLYPLAQPGASL